MIGEPRPKDEIELAWSAIKRAVTARVNFEAQVWRERQLQIRLAAAFVEFKAAVDAELLPKAVGLELES